MKSEDYKNQMWIPGKVWRQICKPSDTITTVLVIDPIARLLLPLFIILKVPVNIITLFGYIVAAMASYMFVTGRLSIGAILFVCWYILDCTDGKVARLRNECSFFGEWLDHIGDLFSISAMIFSLGIWLYRNGEHTSAILAFLLVAIWLIRRSNGAVLCTFSTKMKKNTTLEAKKDPLSIALKGVSGRLSIGNIFCLYKSIIGRYRICISVIHDVELFILVLFVGPIFKCVSLSLIIAVAGMLIQMTIHSSIFWLRRRNFKSLSALE